LGCDWKWVGKGEHHPRLPFNGLDKRSEAEMVEPNA